MSVTAIDCVLEGSQGVLRFTPRHGSGVREGGRHWFRLVGTDRPPVWIEPRELFVQQPDSPEAGEFTPTNCVGEVRIHLVFDDGTEAWTTVDVLPVKLEHETEYRAMLEQIADHAAEAVLQGFAPSQMEAHADPSRDAATSYRTLAFLAARFRDEVFSAALDQIRHHPHRDWEMRSEERRTGAGVQARASTARVLTTARRTVPTPVHLSHLSHLPLPGLPATVLHLRAESSYDTAPNRFVRHVLASWHGLALEVLDSLDRQDRVARTEAGPLGRGRREARWLADRCEEVMGFAALRDAGRLTTAPIAHEVLLRQAGYREVMRAFALAEASMALDASLPDDPFSATQRNVAMLYEYWCFIVLVDCLSAVAGTTPRGLLFKPSPTRLSLVLRQGEASRFSWDIRIGGRDLAIDLWFNHTFRVTADEQSESSSWARALRPDASIRIRPKSGRPTGVDDPELDVWVHFDAKYRVDKVAFDDQNNDDTDSARRRLARRDDLLKMHAYRDAIRRTAGAYVLYPGDGPEAISRELHELLPGLGAFALRPGPDGVVGGSAALERFLHDVVRQVANQGSALERSRFWSVQANRGQPLRVRPVEFLSRPPADSLVLVGYVRVGQLAWVRRTQRYNLRVGDRRGAVDLAADLLTAELVVLWTRSGAGGTEVLGTFRRARPWQVTTADELRSTGYPVRDAGHRYLVTSIEPLAVDDDQIQPAVLESNTNHATGAPWATTWSVLTGTSVVPL